MTVRDGFDSLAGDLDALAPSFGRARAAIERLAGRAREGDPQPVLRAGSRVAEEIALALVGEAGSDAARHAGLDALLARLDAGDLRVPLPAHARAHLETLRRLDRGSKGTAGREEAFATLAAAVALLRWYAGASPETVLTVPAPEEGRAGRRRSRARAAVVGGLLLLAIAAAILAGCRSPEQQLIDRRRELRELVDRLYAGYRAGEPADEAEEGDAADAGPVGRLVAEMERAHFEGYCLAVGRGERPLSLSSRTEAFVHEPAHARECERAARLEAEVAALERRLERR